MYSCLSILCGYQSIWFAIFTKTFAINEGMMPEDKKLSLLYKVLPLERGLVLGLFSVFLGLLLLFYVFLYWKSRNFGPLDYSYTMRFVIVGATLTALGVQTVLSSFFTSILGMRRREGMR